MFNFLVKSADGRATVPFGKMVIIEANKKFLLTVVDTVVGEYETLADAELVRNKILRSWIDVARGAGARIFDVGEK